MQQHGHDANRCCPPLNQMCVYAEAREEQHEPRPLPDVEEARKRTDAGHSAGNAAPERQPATAGQTPAVNPAPAAASQQPVALEAMPSPLADAAEPAASDVRQVAEHVVPPGPAAASQAAAVVLGSAATAVVDRHAPSRAGGCAEAAYAPATPASAACAARGRVAAGLQMPSCLTAISVMPASLPASPDLSGVALPNHTLSISRSLQSLHWADALCSMS